MNRVPVHRNELPERLRAVNREIVGSRTQVQNVIDNARRRGDLIEVVKASPLANERAYAVLKMVEAVPPPPTLTQRYRKPALIVGGVLAGLGLIMWGIYWLVTSIVAAVAAAAPALAGVAAVVALVLLLGSGGCVTTVIVKHSRW